SSIIIQNIGYITFASIFRYKLRREFLYREEFYYMNKLGSADSLLGNNLLYPSEKNERIDTTPVNKVMYKNTPEKWRELLEIYIEQINHEKSNNDYYMFEGDKEDSLFYEFFVE